MFLFLFIWFVIVVVESWFGILVWNLSLESRLEILVWNLGLESWFAIGVGGVGRPWCYHCPVGSNEHVGRDGVAPRSCSRTPSLLQSTSRRGCCE